MKSPAILLAGLLCLGAAMPALATSLAPKPLQEMVAEADQIVRATVVAVELVDGRGRPLTDPGAPTGPGVSNEIRLVLQVQDVLRSSRKVPGTIRVPLWTMWHDSLGRARGAYLHSEGLFLLKGERHAPVYPMDFQRPLEERARIKALMGAP
ncbi:hypothetical protein IAE57_01500 [Stenotrophomonas sp. S48]|uniref:hypothetical protein n=1 Tax=unclassified Stenotrophomonas TaxID=196198 RepID=UPI0019017C8F|nr:MULTISPECIES: hypothetical protein [unclassified Stenotrophomonas]MBK0024826.1 hypothetical protein [Stenotrophomonas sp. S48]MBK0047767.1 hypothetical protein [Stenotrophomonas sp. S49]